MRVRRGGRGWGPTCRVLTVVALAACAGVALAATPSPPPPVFQPTDEWQEVADGQQVPGGLHIRMDLAAGKRYAKTLAPGEAGSTSSPPTTPTAVTTTTGGGVVAVVEGGARHDDPLASMAHAGGAAGGVIDGLDAASRRMKEVLLGLPQPEAEVVEAVAGGLTGDELAALLHRVWARRQVELQDAMATMQTEGGHMQQLLATLVKPPVADDGSIRHAMALSEWDASRVATLTDLEFLVSQLHNADDFGSMGGVSVVTALLNDSNPTIAMHAAWVLGSACKYAPTVQAAALKEGALVGLLHLLGTALSPSQPHGRAGILPHLQPRAPDRHHDPHGHPVAAECGADDGVAPAHKVVGKALYALSALVRDNPAAQAEFKQLGAGHVLATLAHTLAHHMERGVMAAGAFGPPPHHAPATNHGHRDGGGPGGPPPPPMHAPGHRGPDGAPLVPLPDSLALLRRIYRLLQDVAAEGQGTGPAEAPGATGGGPAMVVLNEKGKVLLPPDGGGAPTPGGGEGGGRPHPVSLAAMSPRLLHQQEGHLLCRGVMRAMSVGERCMQMAQQRMAEASQAGWMDGGAPGSVMPPSVDGDGHALPPSASASHRLGFSSSMSAAELHTQCHDMLAEVEASIQACGGSMGAAMHHQT